MSENTEKLRPGARPKGPKSGKGATMATRITAETRAALEAEAERTGRSLSQVAEMWLEEARQGRATVEQMLGGLQVADAVRAMIALAREVEAHYGPPSVSLAGREALVAGWAALVPMAVPFVIGEAPPGMNFRAHIRRGALHLAGVLAALTPADREKLSVSDELIQLLQVLAQPHSLTPDTIKRAMQLLQALPRDPSMMPMEIWGQRDWLFGHLSQHLAELNDTEVHLSQARIDGEEIAARISQPVSAKTGAR